MGLRTGTNQDTSLVSSSSRPLKLRMRADVSARKQRYQGRDYWVIKDPLTLKYYRFEEEEYALLRMLDGRRSPDQIKRQFDYDFTPQKISLQELFQFVGMLYRSSLLVSDGPNQGRELKRRGEQNRKRQLRGSLTNILSIRFRGFDPDGLLTVLNQWTWWFFTWPCFLVVLILGISAGGLLFSNFEVFQNKLPSFQSFFDSSNWIWLALVMGLTKVLHELGHGLACKRFGSQCHEMGVMFLVLTPCLYCNVSDSWMLPSKWKRAFIAAAGMYVELVIASVAVFVWWYSQPGLVNQLALNTIFICSVSTLLFNANPLLRYDGYYILSDLLEIPNLRQKASSVLQRSAGRWMLGIEGRVDPFLPVKRKWFFIAYALAAVVYRWFITFAIFWFLYELLEPYGLKVIGQLIALTAIYGLLGMPLIKLWKFFSVPGRLNSVKPIHAAVTLFCFLGGLVFVLSIPVPRYVYCNFYVEPQDAQQVYVDIPGELDQVFVKPNAIVNKNEPLLLLKSDQLESELKSIRAEQELYTIRLATYEKAAQTFDKQASSAAEQRATVNAQLSDSIRQWKQRDKERKKLTIRAPITGRLLAPDPKEDEASDESLGTWTGTPLEPKNVGAFLDQKTLVGRIVPEGQTLEAHLAISQEEIEFVQNGQDVELLLTHLPTRILRSETEAISPTRLESVPKQLSNRFGGPLVTNRDPNKGDVPQSTYYLIRVPLESVADDVFPGAVGTAKICTGSQTIGARLWRLTMQTFRFSL